MEIAGSDPLVRDTAHTYFVRRPHAWGWINSPFADDIPFPCAGVTRCKILLVCTITNTWLIDSDPHRYIPIMISRMIIALKKVASSRQAHRGVGALPTNLQDSYTPHRAENESIRLSTYKQ